MSALFSFLACGFVVICVRASGIRLRDEEMKYTKVNAENTDTGVEAGSSYLNPPVPNKRARHTHTYTGIETDRHPCRQRPL